MKNEIYNNRTAGAWSWIIATKGRRNITLVYRTAITGDRDVTITYDNSDEFFLLACLNHVPAYDITALIEGAGFAPAPKRIRKSAPIR